MGARAAVLAVVAGLALLEVALARVWGFGEGVLVERSERYGWRFLPDQDAWDADPSIPVHINAAGFRDREWPEPRADGAGGWHKEPGLYCVALLGNSVTYGLDQPIEATTARMLERALQAELERRGDARRARVMNFSVKGYTFEQMARVGLDRARPYRPDAIVLPMFAWDVRPMRPSREPPNYPLRGWFVRTALNDFLTKVVLRQRGEFDLLAREEGLGELDEYQVLDQRARDDPWNPELAPLWEAAFERMDELYAAQVADGPLVIVSMPYWSSFLNRGDSERTAQRWSAWAAGRPNIVIAEARPPFAQAAAPLVAEAHARGVPPFAPWLVGRRELEGQLTRPKGPEVLAAEQLPGLPEPFEAVEASPFSLDDPTHLSALGHRLLGETMARALVASW